MADATRAENAAWAALEEITVTVMRGAADPSARPGSPAGAEGEAVPMSGRARVMKVLMIATNYFEKNPGETHDDVRQLVRNVRPRFEARPRVEPPASNAASGGFGFGSPASSGSGLFGAAPAGGSIFGCTPPKEKK